MYDVVHELKRSIQQLRRNPGFSITAIITLAIGIGATTAIFSIFYAVLLQPLPYSQANRLVSLSLRATPRAGSGIVLNELSYPDFRDWRSRQKSFDSIASYHADTMVLNAVGSSAARNLQIGIASSDFLPTLRVSPVLGRNFTRAEELGGARVVILSHDLWASDFRSSPSILGQSIKLSDELYTVIGVLPGQASFPFVASTPLDLWTTPGVDATGKHPSTEQRGWEQLDVIGRLRPGVTAAKAGAEMDTIVRGLAQRYPDDDANETGVEVQSLLEKMTGDVRPALRVLLIAVGALLLIACANVAGLLLARGATRQTELAVRSALGAGRAAITFQLLVESMLLAVAGGFAGIAVASLTLHGLIKFVPKNLPRLDHIAINAPVLAFAILVTGLTGVLFGLLPARRLSRLDPALALRDGDRTSTAGRHQHRLHSALVVAETALGLVLLVGAGLLIHSFTRLMASDPGFNPDHLLTFRVGLSDKAYPGEKSAQFFDQAITRLNALPGAKSASGGFPMPFTGGGMTLSFSIQEHPTKPSDEPDARASVVEPGFFQTMQIPLRSGRAFTRQDSSKNATAVIVINEALAEKYFPNEDPLGKQIQTAFDGDGSDGSKHWRTVIGVAANVKRLNASEAPLPEYYVPEGQAVVGPLCMALRVAGDPATYAQSVTRAIADIDKDVPVYRIRTMDEEVTRASSEPRFQTLLLTAFAIVALLLAAVGLYAVLSYMVAQRRHEIGLRMALGAQRAQVLELVMRRGFGLALAGLAIGVVASVLLSRFIATLLYGVQPLDPPTYGIVASVLLLVSGIASFIPAARAASLDPNQTLRNQ